MTADSHNHVSETPPESEATLIDRICDAFEKACRAGDSPKIEDYLGETTEPLRSRLFEELLLSDLEFRSSGDATVETGIYVAAFPERKRQIRATIERFWSSVSSHHAGGKAATTSAQQDAGSTIRGEAPLRECGSYKLLHEVARGGMGIVYKAYDNKLQRTVALKMILDRNLASKEAVQRFYAEAEMAASLNHPGIVPVYDVGTHEGYHYYAMGFIEGPTLADELRRRAYSMQEAACLVLELANAVQYAHQHGVVHRDLKPGNILLSGDGQPQITDFGLAKRTDRPSQLTIDGQVMGTPGYMAPEQAAGDVGQSGPAVDVYGLGAILYHLITGHPPFRTALDALVCILEQDPVPPRALNRKVPRDLNVICMKCLNKNPKDRYRSVQQLADDLRSFLDGELIQARPLSWRRQLQRWGRHRPRLASVLLTMLAFYVYHLICLTLGNEGSKGFFHWLATGTTLLVCGYAWVYQTLLLRPRAKPYTLYCWVVTDVVVFSLFLLLAADGASSPLVTIYLCMVASAALSFDRQLVWLVTAGCVISYGLVVYASKWTHPEFEINFRQTVPMAISIAAIGMIQYYVLRCARVQLNPINHSR